LITSAKGQLYIATRIDHEEPIKSETISLVMKASKIVKVQVNEM
jgi:hypothetical protein